MSVNREELKRIIDQISEQDALEVYNFIEYLNMKRKKEAINEMEVEYLAKDKGLMDQVQKSREDRRKGHIYNKEQGLEYLRNNFEES